jgi:hypothetical protein
MTPSDMAPVVMAPRVEITVFESLPQGVMLNFGQFLLHIAEVAPILGLF